MALADKVSHFTGEVKFIESHIKSEASQSQVVRFQVASVNICYLIRLVDKPIVYKLISPCFLTKTYGTAYYIPAPNWTMRHIPIRFAQAWQQPQSCVIHSSSLTFTMMMPRASKHLDLWLSVSKSALLRLRSLVRPQRNRHESGISVTPTIPIFLNGILQL